MKTNVETISTLEKVRFSQEPAKKWKAILNKKISQENLFWYLIYIGCTVLSTSLYFKITFQSEIASFQQLTDFTAQKPFQYRVLLPLIVHLIDLIIPIKVAWAYAIVIAIFTFALLLIFRKFLSFFIPTRLSNFYTLAIFYPIFWNYYILTRDIFPSDIPAILFFTLGLVFLYQKKWKLFYLVFILGCINRETTCFLILAYLLIYWDKSKPRNLFINISGLAIIWVVIKLILSIAFAANGGDNLLTFQLWNNIKYLSTMPGLLLKVDIYTISRFWVFGFIWVLIPFNWKSQPGFIKRLLFMAVPFILAMSVPGILWEFRVYSELIPVITAAAVISLYHTTSHIESKAL
jgi:hypothetical protein